MHAHLINYAFYSLSLNTIDNSLGNWRYTSLIIIYCINKRGFFSRHFYPRCFSLSPSIFPFFSSPFLWQALPTIYPSSKAPLSLFFLFFTLPAGFKLSNFYRLRQTSSLSSIPLFYMCFVNFFLFTRDRTLTNETQLNCFISLSYSLIYIRCVKSYSAKFVRNHSLIRYFLHCDWLLPSTDLKRSFKVALIM